jgi:peptidoglycan-associated lipoprotein
MAAWVVILGIGLLGAAPPPVAVPRPRPVPSAAVPAPRPKAARTVRTPRPRLAPTPTPTPTPRPPDPEYDTLRRMAPDEIEGLQLLAPVYFDEASAQIRDVDQPVLANNAAVLKRFDFLSITLEAHCDGRGDVDYNLRLGDQRAKAVLKRLVALGVPASRLRTVSFGKEVPVCGGSDDECLNRSRRVVFAVTGKLKE